MVQAVVPKEPARAARIRSRARVALGAASLVFVAFACYELAGRWDSSRVSLRWGLVVLSPVPLAFAVAVLAVGWKWLLERMVGRALPLAPTLALHVESNLARYAPGKVGVPLIRIAGAARLGAPANAVGSSVLIEILPYLSVGGAMGSLCLWWGAARGSGALALIGRWGVVGLIAFSLVTLVLIAVDRRRYPAVALRLLGADGESPLVPRRVPLAHGTYWLGWALHGYLVNLSVGATHTTAVAGAGLYVLAPIIGFLAVITPAGVGVREAVLSVGLAPVLGPAPALAAAIVSRTVSLLVNVLAWGVGHFLSRRAKAPGSVVD